jgi:diguanylate cyclase (GGDEF)-like protein
MLNELKQDETGRMMALKRLDVLDTQEEQPFEKIVNLVQQVLQVPICAVSLIDADRQWFKARRGLDVCETARDISFCTHAIQSRDPFVIRDATLDPRFANNPLVTDDPHIRSYAGIPLQTPEGYIVGTLCAIDRVPRDFPDHELAILASFANVIVSELELRQIASTDVLTGAMSRRAWMEQASLELDRARRYDRPLSVLMMDIDRFKNINDTLGHCVGDIVIKRIAELSMGIVRTTDTFGRYGGEEFCVLMPETGLEDALILANRIRTACFQERIEELKGLHVSLSAGVADRKSMSDEVTSLIDRADKALYQAKSNGRNCCVAFGGEQSKRDCDVA